MKLGQVRKIALSFPGAVEQDHRGRPSFRVNEKIFATLWDENHVNVMLDPVQIIEVAKDNPETCEELWWGREVRYVSLDTRHASVTLTRELLSEAWQRKTLKPEKSSRKKRP